jgi:predicted GNAT superfamily acetyltransferase
LIPEAKPIESSPSVSDREGSESTITYRLGGVADIATLAVLAEASFMESGFNAIADYDESTVEAIMRAVLDVGGIIAIALDGENRIAGMSVVSIQRLYFNANVIIASELLWWVSPRCRRSGANIGRHLTAFIENEAKNRGVDVMQMNTIDAARGDRVGRFLERQGYRSVQRCYLKRIGSKH